MSNSKIFFYKLIADWIPAARLPLTNADFGVGMILGRESENGQTEKNIFFCKQIAATFPAARLPLSNADFGVGMILGRKSENCQTEKPFL